MVRLRRAKRKVFHLMNFFGRFQFWFMILFSCFPLYLQLFTNWICWFWLRLCPTNSIRLLISVTSVCNFFNRIFPLHLQLFTICMSWFWLSLCPMRTAFDRVKNVFNIWFHSSSILFNDLSLFLRLHFSRVICIDFGYPLVHDELHLNLLIWKKSTNVDYKDY